MVPLFHKFSCYSLHFRMQYLMLEVCSHQLFVLIVPPHSQNQLSSTPIAYVNSLGSTSLPLPNQPASASAYVSRAELFNILDNCVQKSEFQRLQGKYEKLKWKTAQNSTAFKDDEYYQSIESFGNDKMHEATLHLMEKAFTDKEIRSHSVSGQRANLKITGKTTVFTKSV